MATPSLNARLDKLETLAYPKVPQILLFLVQRAGTESIGDDSITGIYTDVDNLPALQRQQGESVDSMTDRARLLIRGGGVVVMRFL